MDASKVMTKEKDFVMFDHLTSKEGKKKIDKSGCLLPKTYVIRKPLPENLSKSEKARILCLDDDKKAECVYRCKSKSSEVNFETPPNGALTCMGHPQDVIKDKFSINYCYSKCEGDDFKQCIVFGGLGAFLGYVIGGNKKSALIGGISGLILLRVRDYREISKYN